MTIFMQTDVQLKVYIRPSAHRFYLYTCDLQSQICSC